MIKFVLGGAMDPSFKGTLDKSVSEAERAATRINAALSRRTAELERRAKDLPGGSVARLQIENQIATNREKLAQNAHRADYKRSLERKRSSIQFEAEETRRSDVEQARRNIRARELRRDRSETRTGKKKAEIEAEETRKGLLIEQHLRDQQLVKDAQREQASRNIRARAIRRERAEARAARQEEANAGIAAGSMPASWIPFQNFKKRTGSRAGQIAQLGHMGAIGGASSAMMISVARDTAASLASGANPITVFMQQAPQVLQAMTMMGKGLAFLLPIIGAVGAALLAAFATHVISKGIAGIVYGLDAIAAKGERLESTRRILHKVVDEMREAAKALSDLRRAENSAGESLTTALSKRGKIELDAYKNDLEKKNIAGMKLGNLDKSDADKRSLLEKEREILKKELKENEYNPMAPDSPEVMEKKQRLAELDQKGFAARTTADTDEMISLDKQIPAMVAAQEQERKNKPAEIQNRIDEITNEIDQPDKSDKKTEETKKGSAGRGGGSRTPMLEWERAGGFMGGPQVAILDVSKKQLAELIKHTRLLQNASGKRSPWGGQ